MAMMGRTRKEKREVGGRELYRFVMFIFALLLSMFVFVPSSMSKNVPGVEKDKVYIGTSQPFSGPAALWGNVAKAMEAYFKYVNEKKGGVHGRKIILLARDDGYIPSRMRANIEELSRKVLFFAGLMGTANLSANRDLIARKKIPALYPLANVRMWVNYPKEKLRYFFVAYTDYLLEASFLTRFAIEKLGAKKIAVFYQNDDYGENGLKGVRNVAGKKLVAAVSHELQETDFSVHAQKIKDAGADTVVIYSNPRQTASFVKKLAELGVKPKILASFPLSDPIMVKIAGKLWEGAYVGGAIKIPQLYPESAKIFAEVVKYNPELKKTPLFTLFGIQIGMTVEEVLKRAGKDLSREKIIKVLEGMKNFETPVGFPITWGPERRHGLNTIGIWKIEKGGKYVEVVKPTELPPLF